LSLRQTFDVCPVFSALRSTANALMRDARAGRGHAVGREHAPRARRCRGEATATDGAAGTGPMRALLRRVLKVAPKAAAAATVANVAPP
jgi:hypothetical protein